MIRYYIVTPSQTECKIDEVKDTYWFTNPIKREGYKYKYMAEIMQISHWKRRSLYFSDSCYLEVYTYGEKKNITINGWTFKPSEIKANYALTPKFRGMELWFKCTTPSGKGIKWYCNHRDSVCPHSVIKTYFEEIIRISQYPTDDVARKHTYIDPNLHVRRK